MTHTEREQIYSQAYDEWRRLHGDVLDRVIAERDQLAADRRELMEALYGIENTPPGDIQNQVAAPERWWKKLVTDMQDQSRTTLDKIKAREVDK